MSLKSIKDEQRNNKAVGGRIHYWFMLWGFVVCSSGFCLFTVTRQMPTYTVLGVVIVLL